MQYERVISSETELRALLGEPSDLVKRKVIPILDTHARNFIRYSPMLMIGTVSPDGTGDVSPKGDAAGFVHVIDETHLAIPDRPGNKRIDTLRNIVANGTVGLLFMIPGVDETLRINGKAQIVQDRALLSELQAQGKTPLLAIVVEIHEVYLHCAKAYIRSKLWHPKTWQTERPIPSLACMVKDQSRISTPIEELEETIAESAVLRLY
jgi:hypothetical protein